MDPIAIFVADRLLAAMNLQRDRVLWAMHPQAPWSMDFLRRIGVA